MVFLIGCFVCSCGEEGITGEPLLEDEEDAFFTEKIKSAEEEAAEQWEKGYDLLVDEQEREEAETDCKKLMELYLDIYETADKGTASNVVLDEQTVIEMQKKVKAACSIYNCATFNAIMADDSIKVDNSDYEYAHAWFTGDRAAQHRKDYAIGIAMSSRREKAYECINSANKSGWYTGDGATYIYTNYDTKQFDGENFILNNSAVAYRFPGTTEDSQPRIERSIASMYEKYPDNTFAGSMKFYDKYLTAAMDYISFNNEGPDEHPDDYGYGGSNPVHHNDLRVKKAWFCFDDEIICLGAGITSTMNSSVHTTVEHRRIVDAEADNQYADGELLEKCEKTYTGKAYVNMERHAGFVSLDENRFYVNRYVCEGAKGQSFFEVGIDHGENPVAKSYAYAIIPYADNKTLSEYDGVEIISNTAALQAVRDKSTGIVGYVFHEAGECEGISVSAPCIVMLGKAGDEYTLAITDPTHKLDIIKVTLDKTVKVISKSYNISVGVLGGKTKLSVNTFMSNGRKYEIKFS